MIDDANQFAASIRGQIVIAKALAYAMQAIDSLPPEKQEWSDRQDMACILNEIYTNWVSIAAQSVEFHTGKPVDIVDHKLVKK